MFKKIILITLAACGLFIAKPINAASPNLSINIEQPKTPTNLSNLKLTIVALDRLGREVTVKCFQKAPSSSDFNQFAGDKNLGAGGNTTQCEASLNNQGTYQFYATAFAGADSQTSSTVSVEYKTGGPETPTDYSKEKIGSCQYKIKFKSANDGGKTVKVEIYRSENTSFSTDNGTRVGSVNIGSNTEAIFLNDIPDCNKTYYYAIRAFDSVGNGSGTNGDRVTITETINPPITPTPANSSGGAIPVGNSGNNVLGNENTESPTPTSTSTENGTALGESSESGKNTEDAAKTETKSLLENNWVRLAGVLVLLAAIAWKLRKKAA